MLMLGFTMNSCIFPCIQVGSSCTYFMSCYGFRLFYLELTTSLILAMQPIDCNEVQVVTLSYVPLFRVFAAPAH